jgi:hypothetical protein
MMAPLMFSMFTSLPRKYVPEKDLPLRAAPAGCIRDGKPDDCSDSSWKDHAEDGCSIVR